MHIFRSSNLLGVVSLVALGGVLFLGAKRADRANAKPSPTLPVTEVMPKADELLSTALHKKIGLPEQLSEMSEADMRGRRQLLNAQLESWRTDRQALERELAVAHKVIATNQDEIKRLKDELGGIGQVRTEDFSGQRAAILEKIDAAWSEYISALGHDDADRKFEVWNKLKNGTLKEFEQTVQEHAVSASGRRAKLTERICAVEQVIAAKKRDVEVVQGRLATLVTQVSEANYEVDQLKTALAAVVAATVKTAEVTEEELPAGVEEAVEPGFREFYQGETTRLNGRFMQF